MTHNHFYYLFGILLLVSVCSSCNNDEEIKKIAPECSISSPQNNDLILRGERVNITVNFNDPDGRVRELEIFVDSSLVFLTYHYPYDYIWETRCEETGTRTLRAVVMDDDSIISQDEISVILQEPPETGSVTDIDGNTYRTVTIGEQCWMAENLKTIHYSDGSSAKQVKDKTSWEKLICSDKSYCYYNFNAQGDSGVYGALYTWAAATNNSSEGSSDSILVQGICPVGWHIPSDKEWQKLEVFLGMTVSESLENYWRGTNQGIKLRDVCSGLFGYAYHPEIECGFRALPGGYFEYPGYFRGRGYEACFWTSTVTSQCGVMGRELNREIGGIYRTGESKRSGLSLRCIKD
jgi:uncharacterized protein (TIGR02145 family)